MRYDYSFKHVFLNEEVRRHFLSDVLGIPIQEIRSARLANTFLLKRYRRQKQGIMDILIELNDDRKVNIELQVRALSHWDRRSLYYLSRMYAEDLAVGERYERLKKCVCISVLGSNLDEGPEYHRVYRLRDEDGGEYSDLMEIHVIELGKTLRGDRPVDDWIRLFNVRTGEELNMLEAKTKNAGVLEAIMELRLMGLGRAMRMTYEAHMKQVRDRNARDDYVRAEGEAKGRAEVMAEGMAKGEAKGRAEGEARLLLLVKRLTEDGQEDDIQRIFTDQAYREELYRKYNL